MREFMEEIVSKWGVTIRDVARVAGVSLSSVSRALNGGKNVSARVARDVAAAASTLGYQPDFLARSLRTRSPGRRRHPLAQSRALLPVDLVLRESCAPTAN